MKGLPECNCFFMLYDLILPLIDDVTCGPRIDGEHVYNYFPQGLNMVFMIELIFPPNYKPDSPG